MKALLTLGVAAVLLTAACAVRAYPTLEGPTGLILEPTAYVLAPCTFTIAADYVASKRTFTNQVPVDDDETVAKRQAEIFAPVTFTLERDSYPIRLAVGVAKNFEFGTAYDINGFFGRGFWDGSIKYAIPYRCWGGFQTAIGVIYGKSGNFSDDNILFFANTDTPFNIAVTEAYLVGTDNFCLWRWPINASLNVNWAQLEAGKQCETRRVARAVRRRCLAVPMHGNCRRLAK